MRQLPVVLFLVMVVAGCGSNTGKVVSGWSAPASGLQLQISSAPRCARDGRGLASFAVTCEIKNVGSAPAAILLLARLYLTDGAGNTVKCQRVEDHADMGRAKPTIPPGGSTSWTQDGLCKPQPGPHQLHATWDGDPSLKSLPLPITIR